MTDDSRRALNVIIVDTFCVTSGGKVNARRLLADIGLSMIKASAAIVGDSLVIVFGRYDDRDHKAQLTEALSGLGLSSQPIVWQGGEYGSYSYGEFRFRMGSESLGGGFTPEVSAVAIESISKME